MYPNILKSCFFTSVRRYHRKMKIKTDTKLKMNVPNPGIQGKLKIMGKDANLDDVGELDDFMDSEDYAEFDSDFMSVNKSHKMHEAEVVEMKDKLVKRITKSKFFDTVDPSFLTFAEKVEIQSLHRQDPLKWSPERLSESFPALPDAIKKVIKSKWIPKSVEAVQSYDNKVIVNWDKYRHQEIAMSPELDNHMHQFSDRQIIAASKEYIEKNIIPPPIIFPNPRSKLFSSVITNYLKEKSDNERDLKKSLKLEKKMKKDPESTSQEKKEIEGDESDFMETMKYLDVPSIKKPDLEARVHNSISVSRKEPVEDENSGSENKPAYKRPHEVQTLSEFLESSMVNEENTTPLAIAVKHVYNTELAKTKQEKLEKDLAAQYEMENEDALLELPKEEQSEVEVVERKEKVTSLEPANFTDAELATYVKTWVKRDEVENDYPSCIQIPKGRYKQGMTYRFKDCYYDDDGEFLYRVPGMRM